MMLLGKRPRPPIRRTTSMAGITVDLSNGEHPEASDNYENPFRDDRVQATGDDDQEENGKHNDNIIGGAAGANGFDQYCSSNQIMAPVVSPRNHGRNSGDHTIETAHFLRSCGLCKRRLSPGRDIYMYRGDTAFCSQECREQQMKQDERKEKNRRVPSSNHDHRHTDSEAQS